MELLLVLRVRIKNLLEINVGKISAISIYLGKSL